MTHALSIGLGLAARAPMTDLPTSLAIAKDLLLTRDVTFARSLGPDAARRDAAEIDRAISASAGLAEIQTPEQAVRLAGQLAHLPLRAPLVHSSQIERALALSPLPVARSSLPETPRSNSLRDALSDLIASEDRAPTPAEQRELRMADGVRAPQSDALARIVAAFIRTDEARKLALAGPIDVGLLADARSALAADVLSVRANLTAYLGGPRIDDCPLFSIDLSGLDTTYNTDCRLIVDAGGNDAYTNNAGGAWGLIGTALVVDVSGNDTYAAGARVEDAVNGAGSGGFGALFDLSGDDRYIATSPRTSSNAKATVANGAGILGSGMIVDLGGNDSYVATLPGGVANGAAAQGTGAIIHLGNGNATYDATFTSTTQTDMAANGAAGAGGAGLIFDAGGDSTFLASLPWDGAANGAAFVNASSIGQAASDASGILVASGGNVDMTATLPTGAANGAATASSGAAFGLVYHSGQGSTAHYHATISKGAANGGGDLGVGVMVDLDPHGNDEYSATIAGQGAANGGGDGGVGLLLDAGGDDKYTAALSSGGANGGAFGGLGILRDLGAGADTYNASIQKIGGANGGSAAGAGILDDGGGSNIFNAYLASGGSEGAAAGIPLNEGGLGVGGLGVLLVEGGVNEFLGSATTQGSGTLYGVGVLVAGGSGDLYRTTTGAVAQGAAVDGGSGLFIETGSSPTLQLATGAIGQGIGRQGAGMLILGGSGVPLVSGGPPRGLFASDGAGVGLIATSASGTLPTPDMTSCPGGAIPLVAPTPATEPVQLLLCPPTHALDRYVRDPTTGDPLPTETIAGKTIQPTTTGQIDILMKGPSTDYLKVTEVNFDDECEPYCASASRDIT